MASGQVIRHLPVEFLGPTVAAAVGMTYQEMQEEALTVWAYRDRANDAGDRDEVRRALLSIPGVTMVVDGLTIEAQAQLEKTKEALRRPHACTTLKAMPDDLSLRLSRDVSVFPYLRPTVTLWDNWRKEHRPTLEQAYRKLLIDLWLHYRACNHRGDPLRTDGDSGPGAQNAQYEEFNRLTGWPIVSTQDYIQRVGKLVIYAFYEDHDDLGEAMFRFIVTGEPGASTDDEG